MLRVTGDGAFAPFKDTMELLFDKKLIFRWDLLHLIITSNRAHIAAKGKIEDGEESEDEESESTSRHHESLVSELIKFIQSQARKEP